MYSEELFGVQRELSEKTLLLLRDLLPLMAPVAKSPDWSPLERNTIAMLASAAARSTESAVLLCAYGQLWDAEIPIRATFEATLKFMFLLQTQDAFKARHQEYACDLFNIGLMKDHAKASDFLTAVSDPDAKKWEPIRDRIISDEELVELRAKYPKQQRQALEQKWGFTGLVHAFSLSGDITFSKLRGLAHGYSVASHVTHADYIGVSIPLDRDYRSPEKRNSAHLAHLVRLLSDACICLHLRLLVGYRYVGHDLKPVFDALRRIDELRSSFDSLYDRWLDIEYSD